MRFLMQRAVNRSPRKVQASRSLPNVGGIGMYQGEGTMDRDVQNVLLGTGVSWSFIRMK